MSVLSILKGDVFLISAAFVVGTLFGQKLFGKALDFAKAVVAKVQSKL